MNQTRVDTQPVTLSPTPVLRTVRLVLRAPVAGDWPAFHAFMRDDRSRFVRSENLNEGQLWRSFGHVIGHWVLRGYGMFIITETGSDTALGSVGPWNPAGWPEPEIGWSVWSSAHEGKGIVFEAAQAVQAHVRDAMGWTRAVSYIDRENTRSQALARRLGCVIDASAAVPEGDAALDAWVHPIGAAA